MSRALIRFEKTSISILGLLSSQLIIIIMVHCFSVLHQAIQVMLGPMLRGGHLEHVGNTEQRLTGVAVSYNLEN